MRLAIIAFGLLSSILGFTWAGTGTKVVGTPAAGTQAWKIFNDKMSLTILPVGGRSHPVARATFLKLTRVEGGQVGAVIHSLEVPDREGKMRDVVLGFQKLVVPSTRLTRTLCQASTLVHSITISRESFEWRS